MRESTFRFRLRKLDVPVGRRAADDAFRAAG
jgi:hypothetical protein